MIIGDYTTRSNEFKSFTINGIIQQNGTVKFTISDNEGGNKVLAYSDFKGRLSH